MEIADRYGIEEGKLRHVITLPADYHSEIVRQIVEFKLTSKQVKELCRDDDLEMDSAENLDRVPPSAIKMARIAKTTSTTSPQDLVRALLQQEGDSTIAVARLQAMRKLIDEAERLLFEN